MALRSHCSALALSSAFALAFVSSHAHGQPAQPPQPGGPGGPPGRQLPPGVMMARPGSMPGSPPPGGATLGQPALNTPPGFSGQAVAQAAKTDCALSGLDINVQARRTLALVDVSLRVRGVKGGYCAIRPDAVQITTSRSVGPVRVLGVQYVDGQVVRPMASSDVPGPDRFAFWSGNLPKGEEKVVTFRFLVEGDVSPNGEVDAPARLRIDPRFLGPKIYEGAVANARITTSPGQKGRLVFSSGNPKILGAPADYDPSGTAKSSFVFARDAANPLLDWRLDAPAVEAVSFEKIGGGLGAVEYLREGLARELAAGLADPKDKKKVEAAWDHAFDAAWAATESADPFVAGMGARALAWLANDLAPNAIEVKPVVTSPADAGFPAKLAFEAGKKDPSGDAPRIFAKTVEYLKATPAAQVVIVPTLEKGADAVKATDLAKERAKAAKKALTDGGIAAGRIAVKDPEKPAAGAPDADTRRVEIRLDIKASAAAGEAPVGVEQLAAQGSKALAGYAALTGLTGGAPAAHTNRGLRAVLAKIGEPGSHRKDVDAAMKRLVGRIKDGKIPVKFGEFLSTALVAPAAASTVSPNARVIVSTLKGTTYAGAGAKMGAAPRSPMGGRLIREVAGHRGMRRFGGGFIVVLLLALGLYALLRMESSMGAAARDNA